jgi:hypothetical protein
MVGLGSLVAAGILVLLLRMLDANLMGFTQMVWIRTWLVFAMFVQLAAVFVFLRARVSRLLIITIPFLTQYYQVCLGREFPEGATSWLRLTPLLVMAVAMLAAIALRRATITRSEISAMLVVMVVSVWAVVLGQSVSAPTICFLLAVLAPLFYLYVGSVVKGSRLGLLQLVVGISIGVWILLFGTIGTILLGLKVDIAEGSGTLLGTQSMADFNTVYTYVVLAWPFVFILMKRLHWLGVALLILVTIAAAGLGFSRTSALITPALLGVSYLSYVAYSSCRALKATAAFVVITLVTLNLWGGMGEVLRIWALRFDVTEFSASEHTLSEMLESVKPGSSSANSRFEIVAEAVRLFSESPVIGHGWGAFRELSGTGYSSAHNLTADLLVETGLLGASVFWLLTLTVLARLFRLLAAGAGKRADTVLALAAFLLWILVAHSLGGSLYMASDTGFQVNAITALLLALYLRQDVVAGLVRIDQKLS